MLEIGSGPGQHIAHFARDIDWLDWLPSEIDPAQLLSIRAWAHHVAAVNLRPPRLIDAATPAWGADLPSLAGIYAQNVLHIAPWDVTRGLIAGAGRTLRPGNQLLIYGPFREGGHHTGDGNVRFDAALRAQDPAWGLRDVDDLTALAENAGFRPPIRDVMPANNRLLAFIRA